jgi:NTP pyrophosphatase (non-canonical NTP hydrolase)
MLVNEYQELALRTAPKGLDSTQLLLNGALGLAGESGEVVDSIKKHLFQGHWLDKTHIAKELGDVAWYLAIASSALGISLETILQMNIDKLKARYPDGFEAERSVNRKAGDT